MISPDSQNIDGEIHIKEQNYVKYFFINYVGIHLVL